MWTFKKLFTIKEPVFKPIFEGSRWRTETPLAVIDVVRCFSAWSEKPKFYFEFRRINSDGSFSIVRSGRFKSSDLAMSAAKKEYLALVLPLLSEADQTQATSTKKGE